jgi:hypothetical protein
MTLLDVTRDIERLPNEHTIYARRPWSLESAALVIAAPDGTTQEPSPGFSYFLEIFIAREFLAGWAHSVPTPTSTEVSCERLIQYAENDA